MGLADISNGLISLHRTIRTALGSAIVESRSEDDGYEAITTLTEGFTHFEKTSEVTGQPVSWVWVEKDKLTLEQADAVAAFTIEGVRYEVQDGEHQQFGAPDYWRFACQPVEKV